MSRVFCLAKSRGQAEEVVRVLLSAGFSPNNVSVLFLDKTAAEDLSHEQHAGDPQGIVEGASSGALAGGVLGSLTGIGAPSIPGLGPLVAAGRFMATLGGAAIGGMAGGLTAAFAGMGISEDEAKRYEGRIEEGDVLISVHSENYGDMESVKTMFESAKVEEILHTGETLRM